MFISPETGRNKHRHYLLSTLVLFISLIVGTICYTVFVELTIQPDMSNKMVQLYDNIGLSLFCIIPIFGLFLSIKFIHKRPFRTLMTGAAKFRWKLTFIGAGVLIVCMAIVYPLAMLIAPQQFEYQGIDRELILLIILVAIFAIPIQTTVEELFFRGFLLQWFAKFLKSPILLGAVITIIFALMHFWNPEMAMGPLFVAGGYIVMSIAYTASTLILKGTEFAIGVHAANNMMLMIFFLFSENALLAPMSIWTIHYSTLVFFITIYGMNLLWLGFVLVFKKRLIRI